MLAHIIVDIDPFIVRFPQSWGLDGIRWYGVCYIISFFLVQYFLALYSRKKTSQLTPEQNDSLLIYLALGIVIGGRLGYCLLYDFSNFIANPLLVFQVWRGGMASHGGFLGGALAIVYFSKKFRCDIFSIGDIVCSIIPLCLLVGRLGNFINAELVGRITTVPWGVIFARNVEYSLNVRHPSQLYEAFLEGFLLFIIGQILIRRKNLRSGYLSGIFLVLYGVVRIVCECFREPDAGLILNMTRGQFFSLFIILFGAVLVKLRVTRLP